jgi:hypothetical protein
MFARKSLRRAEVFATRNFPICGVHQTEAIAVHQALQGLCENELRDLEPAKLVREIVPAPARFPAPLLHSHSEVDSLDCIELAIAIEEEKGSITDSEMDSFLNDLKRTQQVFDTVLGPVADKSTWDPATVWFRSISSVVDERVRHRGGCSCG